MPQPLVSVIVRTKNEERWIGSCLRAIRRQTYPAIEVVLVDNDSSDQTVAKARPLVDNLVTIERFRPGRALNDGIRASSGEIVVCLSGHCIPTNERWLERLVANLDDPEVAGVYGRQEPLSYTSPLDKRDLLITFGLDRRVQRRDTFFHNANSAMRREIWETFPFDEELTNIEDRAWAKQVLDAGHVIVYEPDASVFHHHGIHHGGNPQRAAQVVTIMERLHGVQPVPRQVDDLRIVALIPSRGAPLEADGMSLPMLAIEHAMAAPSLDEVVIATDDADTARQAEARGASVLRRPPELSEDFVGVGEVLQYALAELESAGTHPDLVVVLEETHPFRPPGLIDDLVTKCVTEGFDTVLAARPEARRLWLRTGEDTHPIGDPGLPRHLRESQTFLGLFGLGCVTHPEFVRDGSLVGPRLGMVEVGDASALLEIRNQDDLDSLRPLLARKTP